MQEFTIELLEFIEKHSILSNILSAFIAALIFFLLKEKIFNPPLLNGKFYLKLNVESSERNPFIDMELHFIIHLSSDNNKIIGGGEKVYEDAPNATDGAQIIHYKGDSKTPMHIEGSIIKNIFSNDEINLLCKVEAKSRKSTMSINLKHPLSFFKEEPFQMNGTFTWSASDKSGKAVLSREKYKQKEQLIPVKYNDSTEIY